MCSLYPFNFVYTSVRFLLQINNFTVYDFCFPCLYFAVLPYNKYIITQNTQNGTYWCIKTSHSEFIKDAQIAFDTSHSVSTVALFYGNKQRDSKHTKLGCLTLKGHSTHN